MAKEKRKQKTPRKTSLCRNIFKEKSRKWPLGRTRHKLFGK
jgi:hypothetical protein